MSSKNKNPFCSCLPISLTHNKVSEEEKKLVDPKDSGQAPSVGFHVMDWNVMEKQTEPPSSFTLA